MDYIKKNDMQRYLEERHDKLSKVHSDGSYSRKCEVEAAMAFLESLEPEVYGDGKAEAENAELREMVADLNLEIRRLKSGR